MRFPAFVLAVVAPSATGCSLQMFDTDQVCQPPPAAEQVVDEREIPEAQGQRPDVYAAALAEAGFEASWRYFYFTEPGGPGGYSECWCVPPPDGAVDSASLSDRGHLIVMVHRAQPIVGGRPPPAMGWGCAAEDA